MTAAPMPEGMADALPAGIPPITWPVFHEVTDGWYMGQTTDLRGTVFVWTVWRRVTEWVGELGGPQGKRALFPSDTEGYPEDGPERVAHCARSVARHAHRIDTGMVFRPVGE